MGPREKLLEHCPMVQIEQHMKKYRHKEFCHFIPHIWKDYSVKDMDPWWQFFKVVAEFNQYRKGSAWCVERTDSK